jgi:hypothetical protein
MKIMVFLLIISSGSFVAAAVFDKRAEQAMPISCMLVIALLYIFYCINRLVIGYYILIFSAILCYILTIVKYFRVRKDKAALRSIMLKTFTPPMILFALLCALGYIYIRHNYVHLWDELRLWAAYPKILYYTEKLQLGSNALLYANMQSYPPGTALFAYFISKTVGSYYECHVFYSYLVMYFSLFMPCLKKFEWNKSWLLLPFLLIIFLLPLTFYNSYHDSGDFYKSLFIDPVLGLFVAYLFFLAYQKCFQSAMKTYQFALALFVVSILKDSGAIFALIALFGAMLSSFLGDAQKPLYKKMTARVCLCAIGLLFSIFSWKLLLSIYNIHNHITISNKSVSDFLAFVRPFLSTLVHKPIVKAGFYELTEHLSSVFFFISMIIIAILLYFYIVKKNRKSFIITSLSLLAANIAFIVGLFVVFLCGFGGDFASYERYINTILLADISYIVFIIFATIFDFDSTIKVLAKPFLAALVCWSLIVFPIRTPQIFNGLWEDEAYYHTQIISNAMRSIGPNQNRAVNVCVIINEDEYLTAGLHHRMYFNLLEYNIFVKNFFNETNFVLPDDSSSEEIHKAVYEWCQYLIDNHFDYVYLVRDNDTFNHEFGSAFESGDIRTKCLYSIDTSDGIVRLREACKQKQGSGAPLLPNRADDIRHYTADAYILELLHLSRRFYN